MIKVVEAFDKAEAGYGPTDLDGLPVERSQVMGAASSAAG